MTLVAEIDGVDVSTGMFLEDGIVSASSSADGTPAVSGIRVHDEAGSAIYQPLQLVTIDETDCTSAPRLFTGYTLNMGIDRGPYRAGASRVWDFDVPDLNFLLHRLIFTAASAKRPAESVATRLEWLLGTPQMNGVSDNGLAVGTVWLLDETDYRDQYPDQVLQSMCVSSVSDENAFVFFVYWDQTANEASLFFDQPTAAVNDSTLRISNVLSEVDDSVTFAPHIDGKLQRDGEAIYDGVNFTTKNGSIYRQRPATYTEFGMHRDGQFSTDRISLGTTAENHAQAWLLTHSAPTDTISCTVRLPSTHVNLIDAGMRIQVKFSHLPDFDTWTWTRVTRRTVVFGVTNKWYELQLELSVKGINAAPGGDPGGFPAPPPATPSVIQQVSGEGNIILPDPIGAGHTLVYVGAMRGGNIAGSWAGGAGADYLAQGWTLGPDGETVHTGINTVMIIYKHTDGTEDRHLLGGSGVLGGVGGTFYEVAGTLIPDQHSVLAGPPNLTQSSGPITARAGFITGIAAQGVGGAYDTVAAAASYTISAGWTKDIDDNITGGHPSYFTGHRFDAGTYAFSGVNNLPSGDEAVAQVLSFITDVTATPPVPGQEVPWTVVVMAGAIGTTAFPYAAGSLKVKVDGVLISPASYVETDPSCGDFTLSWTPDPSEVVTVSYQGF